DRLVLELPEQEGRVAAERADLLEGLLLRPRHGEVEPVGPADPDLEPGRVRPVELLLPARRAPAVVPERVEPVPAEFLEELAAGILELLAAVVEAEGEERPAVHEDRVVVA